MLDADFEVARREFPVAARFRLDAGQRLSLLGPSGAGKTTVLEALAGFVPLSQGEIRLDGRVVSGPGRGGVPPRRRRVGLVSQGPSLFPHLTVLENICYSRGSDPAVGRSRAADLGLARLLDARPGALSEGERRRVVLARALTAGCQLLCLDEPFSALDRPLAEDLLEATTHELEGLAVSAILVTHDLEEAQAFSPRLAVLDRGRMLQLAASEEVLSKPATPQVARLMGYRGWLTLGGSTLAVHPDMVGDQVGSGVGITAQVLACHPVGARFGLELEAQPPWRGRFQARRRLPLSIGSTVDVTVPGSPRFSMAGEADA